MLHDDECRHSGHTDTQSEADKLSLYNQSSAFIVKYGKIGLYFPVQALIASCAANPPKTAAYNKININDSCNECHSSGGIPNAINENSVCQMQRSATREATKPHTIGLMVPVILLITFAKTDSSNLMGTCAFMCFSTKFSFANFVKTWKSSALRGFGSLFSCPTNVAIVLIPKIVCVFDGSLGKE